MTMSTFAAGLALWEGYKNGIYSALFKANSCFWKFLWEHSKPDPNFQVDKKQFSAFFDHFMSFQWPLAENQKIVLLFRLLRQKDFSRDHFGTKSKAVL